MKRVSNQIYLLIAIIITVSLFVMYNSYRAVNRFDPQKSLNYKLFSTFTPTSCCNPSVQILDYAALILLSGYDRHTEHDRLLAMISRAYRRAGAYRQFLLIWDMVWKRRLDRATEADSYSARRPYPCSGFKISKNKIPHPEDAKGSSDPNVSYGIGKEIYFRTREMKDRDGEEMLRLYDQAMSLVDSAEDFPCVHDLLYQYTQLGEFERAYGHIERLNLKKVYEARDLACHFAKIKQYDRAFAVAAKSVNDRALTYLDQVETLICIAEHIEGRGRYNRITD